MSEEEEEVPSVESLGQLSRLVTQLRQAEQHTEQLRAQLKEAEERERKLRECDVPELMLSAGVKSVATESGLVVHIREEVRASWPKDGPRREAAVEWLTANHHGAIIKHTCELRFGRGSEENAMYQLLMRILEEHAPELGERLRAKYEVHHQTLLAFLREQIASGKASQAFMEMCGAFVQKFAEVK